MNKKNKFYTLYTACLLFVGSVAAQDINIDRVDLYPQSLQVDSPIMDVTAETIFIPAIQVGGQVESQTIHVTDQNIFDLVPDRDAISGLAGAQRIKASFWEDNGYTIPLDVSGGLPLSLVISSTVDDFRISVLNSTTSTPPNVVWWVVPFLGEGSYRLQSTIVLPDDSFPVFDRFLTLTNLPPADISVSVTGITVEANTIITNILSSTLIINLEGNTVAEIVQP